MDFKIVLHTDVGIQKKTNQDSLCVKKAETDKGTILMAVVCDGMGGLEKGEVASATVIQAFSKWFEEELPYQLSKESYFEDIRYRWERMIKEQNQNIGEYGREHRIQLGTTVSTLLILEDGATLIAHVGDSRIYKLTDETIQQLTKDQTLMAREVDRGTMTLEQAEQDPRRNVLLQCIGASKIVEPEFYEGKAENRDCFLLCSDGFRHMITEDEIHLALLPSENEDEQTMKHNIVKLVGWNKERQETDNISAILIKTI